MRFNVKMIWGGLRTRALNRRHVSCGHGIARLGGRGARLSSRTTPPTQQELVSILLRNSELDEADAAQELSWICEECRDCASDELLRLVQRRAAGEPLQYVLGSTDFGPLTLRVRKPTLIPRPETAFLASRFASAILTASQTREQSKPDRPLRILDICTGSGCIPLLLRHELGALPASILGVDVSTSAVELARENAALTRLDARFEQADVFSPDFVQQVTSQLEGKADIVVSNPPYIPLGDWTQLPQSVKEWEDPRALVGERTFEASTPSVTFGCQHDSNEASDGLAFYRRIAALLPDLLTPDTELSRFGWGSMPRVVVELGEGQAGAVRDILLNTQAGTTRADIWQDQYGVDRGVAAYST